MLIFDSISHLTDFLIDSFGVIEELFSDLSPFLKRLDNFFDPSSLLFSQKRYILSMSRLLLSYPLLFPLSRPSKCKPIGIESLVSTNEN